MDRSQIVLITIPCYIDVIIFDKRCYFISHHSSDPLHIMLFCCILFYIIFYIAYIIISCNICIQIMHNMQNIAQINTKYIDNRPLHTSFSIFLHIRPSALRHVPLFLIFVVFFPCFYFVLCNSITANLSCKKVLQIYITQYG